MSTTFLEACARKIDPSLFKDFSTSPSQALSCIVVVNIPYEEPPLKSFDHLEIVRGSSRLQQSLPTPEEKAARDSLVARVEESVQKKLLELTGREGRFYRNASCIFADLTLREANLLAGNADVVSITANKPSNRLTLCP